MIGITETLVGIQLVRSSVRGIKEVINTCKDISELSHHLNNLFDGEEQIKKKVELQNKKPKKAAVKKWQNFIGDRLGKSEIGDGTSVTEIAVELIEKRHTELEIRNVKILLNKRFGSNTWSTIMKTRMERLKVKEEREKIEKELAKERAWENKKRFKKIITESYKVLIILGIIGGMYFYISWACKGCI